MHIHASGPGLVAAVFTGMWCLVRVRVRVRDRVRVGYPRECGAWVEDKVRLRPAGSPEASFSGRSCSRLPRAL